MTKAMKTINYFSMMLMTVVVSFCMTACGGSSSNDDDDDGNYGGGSSSSVSVGKWYIPANVISSKASELRGTVNECIQKGATSKSEYFESDGSFTFPWFSGEAHDVEWNPGGYDDLSAIHIISKNTLEAFFGAATYRYGAKPDNLLLYAIDLGTVVGKVGRYANYSRNYTIYEDEDGFWFGDGYDGVFEQFNYGNGQLYQNGGGTWVQYDQKKTY